MNELNYKMKKIITLLFLIFTTIHAFAQSEDEKAVKAVVVQTFEGMQKHDSTMIRACFHPSARMQSMGINRKSGLVEMTTENTIDGFVKHIGSLPASTQIEERVLSYEIRVDAQMATAWTPYELYINGKRQHCGVDAFQFSKQKRVGKLFLLPILVENVINFIY